MLIDARFKVVPVLAANEAAHGAAAINAASVNTVGVVGVAFHMNVTEATTLTSLTMKLQTSVDNSAWVDATFDEVAADADGDLTVVLDDVGTASLSYTGLKQYVRAVATQVGTDADVNIISTAIAQFSASPIAIPGN